MALRLKSLGLAILAAGLLAGCGVRGSLELPPEAKAEAASKAPTKTGEPPPHRPFVLDGLLR